ncbi:MAG TPA: FMN reductase [Mycobacteriales bacterium]|nr:FMN reductase [Mycobacteriales bacterium]
MTARRIAVVTAGTGRPSATRLLADRLAAATTQALAEHGLTAEVEVVELREHARALADNLVTGFPGGALRSAVATVTGADALIAVTPVYAASYSGLFKTFFDLLEEEALAGRPVLLAATAGTARHSLVLEHAMRPLFSHLHAVPVPTGVFAAPEDWAGGDRSGPGLDRRIARAAGQLADLLVGHRPQRAADPFADPVPFSQLLASPAD